MKLCTLQNNLISFFIFPLKLSIDGTTSAFPGAEIFELNLKMFGLLMLVLVPAVFGHGYIQEPPSRSSMWRFGFNTPHNYNDNQLFCGGFDVSKDVGGSCLRQIGFISSVLYIKNTSVHIVIRNLIYSNICL